MRSQEQRPAHVPRDPEASVGLARAAMFRELDRALDEVRVGLAIDAWGRDGGRHAARREIEPS